MELNHHRLKSFLNDIYETINRFRMEARTFPSLICINQEAAEILYGKKARLFQSQTLVGMLFGIPVIYRSEQGEDVLVVDEHIAQILKSKEATPF